MGKVTWNRVVLIAVILFWTITMYGCSGGTSRDPYKGTISFLNSLKDYYALLKIDIADEKENRIYRYKQWVRLPDHYRLEVLEPESLRGKVTVSDGEKTWMSYPRLKETVELKFPDVYQGVPLFIGDFLSRYWNSEKATMERVVLQGKECVVLSYPSVGRNPNYYLEKLVMDVKARKPLLLTVYDQGGKEVVRITFEEFRPLSHLEDALFKVPNSSAKK